MVQRLAIVGQGQHAHARLRELLGRIGLLGLQTAIPRPIDVTVMLLPSTLVKVLWKEYPTEFRRLLGAEMSKLRTFRESFCHRKRTRAWAAAHPHLRGKSPADLVTTVPCAMHSDAGPCTKVNSAYCISWSSMLGSGGEKVSKSLAASFVKAD